MTWTLDPLLVWGLFQRGIGLVLLVSFISISTQVVEGVGSNSVLPFAGRLKKLREDFPSWKRFFYFPTLLWCSQGNWMFRLLAIGGIVASLAVIIGGPFSVFALGVCYLCYLSLDLPLALLLPWDSLLFEMMVLGLFTPPTEMLPSLAAAHAPTPAITWVFRLLFFRLLFGFGKQKFIGARREDAAYLSGFMVNQPLLSPGGWYGQKLPMWVLKLGLYFMFLVEIPIPFFAFIPGLLSVIAAVTTILLMVGIQLSGNFGYFSLLTMVLCLPLLDNVTPRALELTALFAAGQPMLVHAFLLVHTVGAIITFPFNSWLAQGWHLWAFWYQFPRWVQWPLDFFRALHPFRWLHPYGVFPANTTPAVKTTLLLEVSWDEQRWHEVRFKYAPTHPDSRPRFVAPHHPRGEQAIIYDTFGMNYTSLLSTMIPGWDPTLFCSRSPSHVFCQSVLQRSAAELFPGTPLASRTDPPRAARITTTMLEPTSLADKRRTGHWWKRTYVGPHCPPQRLDPDFGDDAYGAPELWHFDNIFWRRRSRLAPLMRRAREGSEDPLTLALLDSDLSTADMIRFWDELWPLLAGPDRASLSTLPAAVARLNGRFTRAERRRMERILGRLSLILVSRLEPLYHHRGLAPLIPVRTNFHLWMLAHHIIGCGKQAYLEAVAQPMSVVSHVPDLTPASGLYALSLFRFYEMTFDAQKLRLLESYFYPHDPARKRQLHERLLHEDDSELSPGERRLVQLGRSASGFYSLMPHLREAFVGPAFDQGYPECYPTFQELDSGEVVVQTYGMPDPQRPLAPDIKSLPSSPYPETAENTGVELPPAVAKT